METQPTSYALPTETSTRTTEKESSSSVLASGRIPTEKDTAAIYARAQQLLSGPAKPKVPSTQDSNKDSFDEEEAFAASFSRAKLHSDFPSNQPRVSALAADLGPSPASVFSATQGTNSLAARTMSPASFHSPASDQPRASALAADLGPSPASLLSATQGTSSLAGHTMPPASFHSPASHEPVIPPTPMHVSSNPKKPEHLFPGLLPPTQLPSKMQKNQFYDPKKGYVVDGVPHILVKQISHKSCGAAALLMLYIDITYQNRIPFSLTKPFWDWYRTCDLTTPEFLIKKFEQLANLSSMELRSQQLDPKSIEANLRTLENQTARSPVILSITHPVIRGHWILLDAIKGEDVYIRDPYSGCAYKITKAELRKLFSNEVQSFLYLTVKSRGGSSSSAAAVG